LEKQDVSVPAALEAQTVTISHDDAASIVDASFLVKSLLERRELRSARLVFETMQSAVTRHRHLFPLQLSYADALIRFDTGASAPRVLKALEPGVDATRLARQREELAFAVAILWRAALLKLFLGHSSDARRHLDQATSIARDLGDPTMNGVVATAQGWYEVRREEWRAARRAFLSGLLLIEYDGRPRRLWSDLALGVAMLELTAPSRYTMKTFDVQVLLDACANAVGKLRPYPMYVDGGGSLDAMVVADAAFTNGHRYRLHTRNIPASIRHELERAQEKACRRCERRNSLVIDHVWFFSWGGTTGTPRKLNVRWLCRKCNGVRSNRFDLDRDAYDQLVLL
jgi:hypothetical protein